MAASTPPSTNDTFVTNEQIYFDALKKIAKDYMTVEQIRTHAEALFGCGYTEALEMAYENLKEEAAAVIRWKRRPK